MADPKHLVRTRGLPAAEARRIKHPLNLRSEVAAQALGDRVGMRRAHAIIARVLSYGAGTKA